MTYCVLGRKIPVVFFIFLVVFVPPSLAASFRVMTFNMLCGICSPLKYGGWDERLEGLTDTLQRAHPDLLAAQELVFRENVDTITHALPNLEPYYLDHGFPYFDSVVFYNRDRFDIIDKGAFWLSEQPDAFLGLSWQRSLPRSLVWIHLRDRYDGKKFYFAGTHVDNNHLNKEPSVKLIREKLSSFSINPAILAGDFNSILSSLPGQMLTRAFPNGEGGFIDSFNIANQLTSFPNNATSWDYGCINDKPKRFPECRIDHIFLSNEARWKVERYTVDMNRYGWRNEFISDHRAVWADLNLVF